MINLKKKKPPVLELRKTYTETEEMQYRSVRKLPISKRFIAIIIASTLLLSTSQFCNAWDGAGGTWSCGNCGTSNYNWQMSCGNCGNSQ